MAGEAKKQGGRFYQVLVTSVGIVLWLVTAADLLLNYGLREQGMVLVLVPIIIFIGGFVHHFRLPLGLKFTKERITFTLADSIVLMTACWFGFAPAVIVAGIEGFTSSRRTTRRLSSNFFSSSIMSLGAAAAALTLTAVMRYQFGEAVGNGSSHRLAVAGAAILAASVVQIAANIILLSTLLALRHQNSIVEHWKHFLWAVPLFLPNSAVATLIYYSLQNNLAIILFVGGPLILALYLGHRQYRDGVQKRIAVMEKAHRETIEALAVAINAKDEVTHEHVMRVQIYAAGIARLLGCSDEEVEALKAGALLHDIGKIAVPDYILNKPGKLTALEFEKMKLHTIAGAQILSRVEFPYPVVPVVRHHHERWDGCGYPDGLRGEEIPITARILSVVDCFDAVREDRQYRKGMTREQAIDLIMKGSGSQYDPHIVGKFIKHLPEFEAEIQAQRHKPVPTFGIEANEELSESARKVPPAAGLAEEDDDDGQPVGNHIELKAVSDVAQAVICAGDGSELVAAFAARLKTVVPFDLCAITLVHPESGQSVVEFATGEDAAFLQGRRLMPDEGVTGWVITNRSPFFNTDPKLDLPASLLEKQHAYRTLAICPILKGETFYGALSLYSATLDAYSPSHQRLLKECAQLLATAFSAPARRQSRAASTVFGESDAAPLPAPMAESKLTN